MKKIFLAALLIALTGVIPLPADTAQGVQSIDFSIRFFDKRIYYAEGDPIYVQITITNNSPAPYRFKLADERAFSIDFDIRTVGNRALEPADVLIRKRTQSQQVFFREIAVEAGEAFSFVEDLRDYVNLSQAGSFTVQAKAYPELYRSAFAVQRSGAALNGNIRDLVPVQAVPINAAGQFLLSNRLNLTIRPPLIYGPDGVPVEMDTATGAVLVREKLPPDQVIEYMLVARQKSQWEKFFLYLDLEMMLSRDAARRREWLNESEAGRRQMVIRYRQELQGAFIDGDISTIPVDFTIERTTYAGTEGTVTVLQKFRVERITEVKRYTYYLSQKDNIWTVVNYSVVNLGTE